jgi:hypothetical protein
MIGNERFCLSVAVDLMAKTKTIEVSDMLIPESGNRGACFIAALRLFAPVLIGDKPDSVPPPSRHRLGPLHTTIAVAPPSRFLQRRNPGNGKANLGNSRVEQNRECRNGS